jgi:hypothetical protein
MGAPLYVEDARGVAQLVEHALVQRLEPALLGRSEVLGEREGGEVSQRRTDALQLPLQLDRPRRGGGTGRLGMQAAERVAQKRSTVGRVGGAVGVDERLGIARRQAMALHDGEDRVLVLALERAQGARQRHADGAFGELALGRGGQPSPQRQSVADPVGLVAEHPRDLRLRAAVLGDQGADDAGLVERRAGARRRVGREQQALVLGG